MRAVSKFIPHVRHSDSRQACMALHATLACMFFIFDTNKVRDIGQAVSLSRNIPAPPDLDAPSASARLESPAY